MRSPNPSRHPILLSALLAALLLAACGSTPPPPSWQLNARSALERGVSAYLSGNSRVAQLEFDRARQETSATGRADLVARAELTRCAARLASLVFEPCTAFDALRADASAAERAYGDYLAGRVQPTDVARLPTAQQQAATAHAADTAAQAVQAIQDPFSRLVAAGVLLQAGHAGPQVIDLAVDTASIQGWRRPLLAWLQAQARQAELAGDAEAVQRIHRRMALVATPPDRPAP